MSEYKYLEHPIPTHIVNQIRADAIEEFAELLLKHKSKDDYPIMCFDEFTVKRFAEQLKEQNDGRHHDV